MEATRGVPDILSGQVNAIQSRQNQVKKQNIYEESKQVVKAEEQESGSKSVAERVAKNAQVGPGVELDKWEEMKQKEGVE